ncbi:MAG: AAA family ATPase, partial [Chloroflexi bacterium]|nr:AAA family ATPase [Chloroflexota bacterium]
MLSIRLLGAPQILFDGQPVQLARRKSRALIYYLAAHPSPLARERLLAFFWPDASRASAQQVLRTTLSGLRKTLGAALVVSDESVALAADSEVDARAFEARLSPPVADAPRLTQTLDLYRGDFLSDFTLPGAPEFDDWAAVERERYRRLRVRGLMALSQLHEAARNYSAALDALDRALAPDPLQEDLQRAALRLHYLGGDRAGAIRRYEQFRRLLDDEMGVPPMAETRALYDAIITDTLAANPAPVVSASPARHPDTTPPASLPFVGRAAEMDALRALAAAGKLALIEGEPGIGKTRLAEEFIRASGALALIGRARELEQALPYQPVIEALRGLLRHPDWPALSANLPIQPGWWAEVARLLPELRSSSAAANPLLNEPVPLALAGGNESHLWEGLYQFLSALGRQRRVIFLLDDAHWADASTLALAGYLTRRGQDEAGAPVQVILTTRAVEVRSPLAALLPTLTREGRLGQLTLRRLSGEEVARLAKTLSQSDAQRLGDWLAQASEGNPYIVHELVREARAKNILRPDGVLNAEAFTASPVVPQSVYVLIQSRLAQLSDAARRVLDAAVAAGR